jgi:hypothetical protein
MTLPPGAYTPEQVSGQRHGQPYPGPGPARIEFPAEWTPEKIQAFEAEFAAFMRDELGHRHAHAIRLLPPGKPVSPVTHIAGAQVEVGSHLRQRCSWCGAILADYDLTRIAVPEGQDPRPAMWETGKLVRVDGPASWIVEHEDGADLPADSCAALELGPGRARDGGI